MGPTLAGCRTLFRFQRLCLRAEERFWVHAWVYRDWVVNALNDDMPYDRFLLLQLAADQVECDTHDLAAMGFLTLGRRFLEYQT